MESWRYVWRVGLAPTFSSAELDALRVGLELDDPALVQGACVVRDGDYECASCRVVGGCAIGYAIWNHGAVSFDDEVLDAFQTVLVKSDFLVGYPLGTAPFLSWFDDTPREEMRRELLLEVKRSLALRAAGVEGAPTT